MIKRFTYIVLFLAFMPGLSFAWPHKGPHIFVSYREKITMFNVILADTTKGKRQDDPKKIKEIAKARRQPKPEKIDDPASTTDQKTKPKRERRPEGLERPPEIPRRNGGG
jgi:hypothetical protein